MGMGYTTIQEHYLGLRNYFEDSPSKMEKAVVFVMTDGVLPWDDKWKNTWTCDKNPELIVPLLKVKDFPGFLISNTPLELKSQILFSFGVQNSRLWSERKRWRESIFRKFKTWTETVFQEEELVQSDMVIYQRKSFKALLKKLALESIDTSPEENYPDRNNLEGQVIPDMVELVDSNGGWMLFVNIPCSSLLEEAYYSEERKEIEKVYDFENWGYPIVCSSFHYTDEDFPDYWHLSVERRGEFSSQLGKEWLKREKEPGNHFLK